MVCTIIVFKKHRSIYSRESEDERNKRMKRAALDTIQYCFKDVTSAVMRHRWLFRGAERMNEPSTLHGV